MKIWNWLKRMVHIKIIIKVPAQPDKVIPLEDRMTERTVNGQKVKTIPAEFVEVDD